jgi:hypothetical protein
MIQADEYQLPAVSSGSQINTLNLLFFNGSIMRTPHAY